MDFSILGALFPVMLVIATGWAAVRLDWVRQSAIKDISNVVFMVLLPALLFRTMANVTVSELDFYPVGIYFLAVAVVFGGTMAIHGLQTWSAARALAHTFSNVVMVGVPLVSLLFGDEGLVPLFTLVTVHALVLLGCATIIFEVAVARERAARGSDMSDSMWRAVGQAVRSSILHPVPIPILAGILYAQTGWPLPDVLDTPLRLMGAAMGPMALLLVGMTLGYARIRRMWRPALRITLVKCLLLPLVFFICAMVLGARGMPFMVLLVCASLPIGTNVLFFTHRYGVGQEEVVASMAISTVMALICIPVVMRVLGPYLAA